MNDRDKEIEVLAMRLYESRLQAPTTAQWRGVYAADAFDEARAFFDMLDVRLSTTRNQPPAPEAAEPTPPANRMGKLEMLVRLAIELGDRYPVAGKHANIRVPLRTDEITRLQALAAELTAKDGRDG